MKNLSKLLSVLLCLAMVLGIFTMAVSAADPVKSVTYDFLGLTKKGTKLTEETAKTTFDGAASGNFLVSVAATNIYDGNGNGGAWPNTTGLLKTGGSSATGKIVLTYESSVRITSVEILCHSWKTDGTCEKVSVNGSATQDAPSVNPATAGTLTFDLAGDSNVVTIDFNKRVFIFKIIVHATNTGFVTPSIPATAIEIPETAEIVAGTSLKMSATVTPSTTPDDISWTSSNEAVATVNDGTIKALTAGTTTITVTAGAVSDTCTVTVVPGVYDIVTPYVGGPFKLAIAQNQEGKFYYFNGATTDKNYQLDTSANIADAADVYLESSANEGKFYMYFLDTANNNTKTYIEAYNRNGSGSLRLVTETPENDYSYDETLKTLVITDGEFTGYIGAYNSNTIIQGSSASFITADNLDVSQYPARLHKVVIPVTGVTLDKTSQNMTAGNTMDLVATVAPGNATNKAVTWTSSKTDVATVDQTGKVTAVAPGTATITVTTEDGGKTATCEITVVAATVPATGVTLDKTSETLNVGGEVNLTATVAPADTTDTLTWTTSNANVATVAGGKVTAVGVGTATITATAGDKSATCTITVAVAVSKVELDKATANMTVGGETTLTATVTVNPNADTYKNVTWTTSDATVATVENGKVKALKAGTVTITATSATDNAKKAECTITVTEPVVSTNEGKITSLEDLVTGTYVLVVDSGYAAGVLDGTWVSAVQPTIESDKVTDAKGGIWTLTVTGNQVTIKDANGKFIAPKGGNNNGIKEGEYSWTVTFEDGKFIFSGNDDDTVRLASNIESDNKFRGYKNTTATGDYADGYPSTFALYAVGSAGSGSGTGSTDTPTPTGDTFEPMVIILALAAVSALAVLALNKKKFIF